jgi:hypothetical protein
MTFRPRFTGYRFAAPRLSRCEVKKLSKYLCRGVTGAAEDEL